MKNLLLLLFLTLLSCQTARKPINIGEIIADNPKQVFHLKSNLDYMKKVVDISNCVVNNKDFQSEVKAIDKFDYTDHNGKQVIRNLLNAKCVASTYRSRNPWSKAIATTYATDKVHFYFNTRRNPREMRYMINTSVHECLHLANYSHDGNSSIGKENSVNYKLGSIAEKYVATCGDN